MPEIVLPKPLSQIVPITGVVKTKPIGIILQERGDRGRVGVVEGVQCGKECQQEDVEREEEVTANMFARFDFE